MLIHHNLITGKNLNILLTKYLLIVVFFVSSFLSFAQPITFNYTGNVQSWTVPPCVNSITITAAGAKGGGGASGGNGAVVTGTIAVTPGQVLQIRVGGTGNCTGTCAGGYNGGGNGDPGTWNSCGGGGASDVRITPYALGNRIIVGAGGGGRAGGTPTTAAGGSGGCAIGNPGIGSYGGAGNGGTQTAGGTGGGPYAAPGTSGQAGTLGQGGNCGLDNCASSASGGGGGGGLYGGGGGGPDCISLTSYIGGGGGGGGSSLIPPGGTCSAGTNSGPNGYVTINYTVGPGSATATNTGPYCQNATIQLNAAGGGTYSWAGPNNFTSTAQNPTIPNATTANAGVYTLTVTNPGCVSTATTTVVVNPLPIVGAGLDQTVCEGTSVTLAASGATGYAWTGGITDGVSFVPTVGTTTYTVTGTTNGCSATDDVNITVNPLPTVNAGLDQTICAGTSITLTAQTNGTAASVSWTGGITDGVSFTPTATSTYTVTALTSAGCTSSDAVDITINPLPIVEAGADQTVCEGSSVTVSGSGAVSYVWNNGITDGVAFVPAVGTLTYVVTGTSALNCTATDFLVVTVNANPVPVITGPTTYCAGTTSTLATVNTYNTYVWSNGASTPTTSVNQTNNPITVTVTNGFNCTGISQPYTVNELPVISTTSTVTICQGSSATIHGNLETVAGTYSSTFISVQGCDSTSTVTLVVNPLPVVAGGNDIQECQGTSIQLNASGATTYAWTGGVTNGISFTQAPGVVTYTVTGTDNNGCSSTDQVTVTIFSNPVINAGNDVGVCPGESATLFGSGGVQYVWNNGIVDGVSFIPLNTQLYTVTGTDANGCTGTDQVNVTVYAAPPVNAGIDQTLCLGDNAVLSASGASIYTWTGGIANGVAFLPSLGTTTYTVTGEDNNGCVATDDILVTVLNAPLISFTSDITTGCVPLTVQFTNTGDQGVGAVWNFGDGNSSTTNGTVSHTFNNAGCYDISLTITNAAGCSSSMTTANMICVEGAPNISFFATPSVISEFNSTVQFINNTTNAASYSWNFGDGTGSVEIEPSHEYSSDIANYSVTLTAASANGCIDSASIAIVYQEEVIFYIPNSFTPDGDMFNQTFQPVFTSGFDPFNFTLTIYNRWGELIFESHDAKVGWDGTYGGKLVQEGTYTWKIEFKATNNDDKFEHSGHVNFIR
jgi:gliding motility-associated-like protein